MGAPTIDRYVPNQSDPAPVLVNPLPDPMKLEFQVGFTWFAEWWRGEERVKEEKAYAKQGRRAPLKGEREMRQLRDRAQRELDRLDEIWTTFTKLSVKQLIVDEMLYRDVIAALKAPR